MKSQKFSNLIQLNAESIGVKALDNEIVDYLNIEIEEKIKLILHQSKKFMRISKRKTLKVDDLNHSLQFYNFHKLQGYDSYANSEYEKIESVKGLWRQKQNIIDIEEYLSKPISSYPMKSFPHFYWFAIEGQRPNISENFIREEYKGIDINSISSNNIKKPLIQQGTNDKLSQEGANGNLNGHQNSHQNKKIPVIHNISKELQIFFENFIQRFRKEVKMNKLNTSTKYLVISKELEVSITVIQTSPGVVELLPYIIEFLLKSVVGSEDSKILMLIVYYINAILQNEYFFIEPYLHQIISLLLTLLLIDIPQENFVDPLIKVKIYAVKLLKVIVEKFKLKYPNLSFQLAEVFKDNLVPQSNHLFTAFGAAEGLHMLGPGFSSKTLTPEIENKIEESLRTFTHSNDEEKINTIFIQDNLNKDMSLATLISSKEEKFSNVDELFQDIENKKINCFIYALNNIKKSFTKYNLINK